jgi:hypothetical protein
MRSRYVGAALLVAVALSTGCGLFNSDNKGEQAAGPAPATAGPTAGSTVGSAVGGPGSKFAQECPSSAVVGGLLGMTFKDAPRVTKATGAIVCSYTGTRNSDNAAEYVLLNMHSGDATDMARARQDEVESGNSPVSQSGIGDEAYSFQTQSIRSTLTNLVVRKGNRMVQVGGEASLAQLTAVVTLLLAS